MAYDGYGRRYVEYDPPTEEAEVDRLDWKDELFVGEQVQGLYGDSIGTVGDIMDYGFRIDRPFAPSVTLPFEAIRDIVDGRVHLNVPADQVGTSYGPYGSRRYRSTESWSKYGPYTGRGPRGYTRSDEQIRDDVNDNLWIDDQLDATGIDVLVNDGVVTLDGVVDSRWAKRRAEDDAWSVPGVVDVQNNLRRARGDWDNWRDHMHLDMDVVGSYGSKVGAIGEIRDYDFLMNRDGQSGIWIPFSAIQDVRNDRVILNVPKDEIDRQGWATTSTSPG